MNPSNEAAAGITGILIMLLGAVMLDTSRLYITGLALILIGARVFWNAFTVDDDTGATP